MELRTRFRSLQMDDAAIPDWGMGGFFWGWSKWHVWAMICDMNWSLFGVLLGRWLMRLLEKSRDSGHSRCLGWRAEMVGYRCVRDHGERLVATTPAETKEAWRPTLHAPSAGRFVGPGLEKRTCRRICLRLIHCTHALWLPANGDVLRDDLVDLTNYESWPVRKPRAL